MLTPAHKKRLDRELILWLTTVRKDGQPQTLPVWFLVADDQILVWSLDGQRVANLVDNQRVSAHVNDNGRGGEVLSIEGIAAVDSGRGQAVEHPGYVARYQPFMDAYDWTWDWFGGRYKVPIVITPTKVRIS